MINNNIITPRDNRLLTYKEKYWQVNKADIKYYQISKKINIKFLIKELSSFVSCRLLSGIIEMILMYTMISLMSLNDFIVKIITNVVVVILNFIFSKLIIFKNK